MPGPTASSEFRRGLDPCNPMIGAGRQALVAALGLFVIITGMHMATHTYFGWRFARGIRAAAAGQHGSAARLLAPVERPGMSHRAGLGAGVS